PSATRCEGSRPAARRRADAAAASASSGNGPTLTQRLDAMERSADSSGAAAVAASSDVAFPSASADSAATSLTRRIGVPLVAAADLVWGSGAYHADHAPKPRLASKSAKKRFRIQRASGRRAASAAPP